MYEFYNEDGPLYLETDTSGVGLGLGLLHVKREMTCQKCMTPDGSILQPIVFESKRLWNMIKQ